jgi:DNA-directed RNA polymerase specialized sigma24 family protein
MNKEKNAGTDPDEVAQNEFTSYLQKAMSREREQFKRRQNRCFPAPPDEIENSQIFHGLYGTINGTAAETDPESCEEFMSSIENPKLFRELNRLRPEERQLLFYRLICQLPYKEICLLEGICAKEVETRFDTLLRKIRRH